MTSEDTDGLSLQSPALVIESVLPGSVACQTGLQVGDCIVSYEGKSVSSPAALLALEENTFGKEQVLLQIEREGAVLERLVATGTLGVEVRPELPSELSDRYEAGREQYQAGAFIEAAQQWQEAAAQTSELAIAAWLYGKAGEAWEKVSDWQQAIKAYKRAWEFLETSIDTVSQSQTAMALGRCHQNRSEWDEAASWYMRAEQVDGAAGRERWRARNLNNRGNIAFLRGDLQAAQDYHSRALQIRERLAPNSLDVAYSLNNLGAVAYDHGDLEAAQDYHSRALKIRERLAPNSLDVAYSLNNLGNVASQRGDLEAAWDYYTRALQIRERFAPNSLDVAASLNNLGGVAYQRGELEAAQDYHTRALQIQERLAPTSLDCAESLTQLGQTLLRLQHFAQALLLLQQAIEIVEQQRSSIGSVDARALLLAQHTTKYAALIQGNLALNQHPEAFSTLERSRARSLLELLAERRLDFTTQAPLDLLQQQHELDRQRAQAYDQLAKLSATADDQPQIEALHSTLRELQRSQQELTAQIRLASPQYASLQYPQPLDLKAAQEALDPDTLLLSYLVDEEQTFLFAVTKKILHCFTLPLGRKSLAEQVQQLRQALDLTSIENSLPQAIQQGQALYDLLLAPVASQIKRAKHLLLCPDGPLHSLPWSALVTKAGRSPRYLGQQMPLHTTLSMTLYAQTREDGRGKREEKQTTVQPTDSSVVMGLTSQLRITARKLLALGDPVYASSGLTPAFERSGGALLGPQGHREEDTEQSSSIIEATMTPQTQNRELAALCTRGLSLDRLLYSRKEVESIGQLFAEQAVVKVGKEATKTVALNESSEVDLLHFACHGWLDARDPLSSGLVLSQPEALGEAAVEGDNGLLQAWEIFSKLRLKANLVVLSACQTGLGQEVRGEGLIGLTRAFQYAGAQSVLVSLWEVNDESTSVFMQAFYSALKAGVGKAEALQRAMEAVRQNPEWDHPFYWAAFTLSGDGK